LFIGNEENMDRKKVTLFLLLIEESNDNDLFAFILSNGDMVELLFVVKHVDTSNVI